MLRLLVAIALSAAASGCAVGTGKEQLSSVMRSWIGTPIDDAIAQWGAPTSVTAVMGRSYYYWLTADIARPELSRCVRRFETGSDRLISNWTWMGNDCKYFDEVQLANWQRKG